MNLSWDTVKTKMVLIKESVSQVTKLETSPPPLPNKNQTDILFSLSLNPLKISVDIRLEEFHRAMKDQLEVLS